MGLRTDDFDYDLPKRAIAQPPARRGRSRMLVLDRMSGRTSHRTIRDLPTLLNPGDLLVMNDTKVFRARLRGNVEGRGVEVLLVRPTAMLSSGHARAHAQWTVLAKPARRLRAGSTIVIGRMRGTVLAHEEDGSVRVQFDRNAAAVIAYANRVGEVPTPPYVAHGVRHLADYQTTYARRVGSVAAPTAGFHLTPLLLRTLNKRGVRTACVTLHVGLGTFQPIRTERLADHLMHAEWVAIPAATARAITSAKQHGNHVIAVGTTTLRALEGFAAREGRIGGAAEGWVDLFITPGFRFRVVDALLTNFHLPRSTLLVLASAFVAPGIRSLRGRDMILRAYRSALHRGYRFYSFGDAMFIVS